MLTSIVIDGYQRIAFADIALTDPINVFVGPNEAGKSSLKEAIGFLLRDLSPRIKAKGDRDQLIYRGKKTGIVRGGMDGFDIARTIKDGKLKTVAPLDYPELLVDLQLGIELFGEQRTAKDGPAAVRQLLQKLFKLDATVDVIKQRLMKDGVTKEILDRTIPLIKAGGFESASKTAGEFVKDKRAAWKQLTGETFGAQKAQTWEPINLATLKLPTEEQLSTASKSLTAATAKLGEATKALGALETQAKLWEESQGDGDAPTVDDILSDINSLEAVYNSYVLDLKKARDMQETEMKTVTDDIERIEKAIQEAKMATATLECPGCAKPLMLHTAKDGKVSLVAAPTVKRREGPSLAALANDLRESQELKVDLARERGEAILKLERHVITSQQSVSDAKVKLARVQSIKAEPVTAEQVEKQDAIVKQCEVDQAMARSALDKLRADKLAHESAVKSKKDATALFLESNQWEIVSKGLSNDADSIPSELVGKTIGPVNDELLSISMEWGQQPIALAPDMSVARGDGTPYNLLSESARWRADVTVQLALARLSALKLVIIDRFDVLEAAARPAFFDMLSAYAASNAQTSVIVMGTLKGKPADMPGIKFWWVEDGQIGAEA